MDQGAAHRRTTAPVGCVDEDHNSVVCDIQGIRDDLKAVLDKGKLTAQDAIHIANEESGMDKYKTMKKAQSGTRPCLTLSSRALR